MTKLVKKGNPSRFITGDDVIITKGIKHPGKTVDEVIDEVDNELDEHKKDIDKLKSNLKYLYSYGGVGGNARGGSGSGSTGDPTLFVSLNNRQILSGSENKIILPGPDNYILEGGVRNNNGKTFIVTIGYGKNINRPTSYVLNADNRWKISETSLRLNENGTVVIKLYDTDNDFPIYELSQEYIVNAHTFSAKFMYEYDNGLGEKNYNEFNPYEYFIGNTSQTNPYIDVTYKIAVSNPTNIQVEYEINGVDVTDVTSRDFDTITSENPIDSGKCIIKFKPTDTNNTLKIYLDNLKKNGEKFTSEINNGTYDVTVKFSYSVSGNETKNSESFKITLIPNDLYIYVKNSHGMMYDSLEEIQEACDNNEGGIPPKNISLGTWTSFSCKVFEGPMINEPQRYTLYFNVYDYINGNFEKVDTLSNSDVIEQVETVKPFQEAFNSTGIKKLEFSTRGTKRGETCITEKFIYITEPTHQIKSWYPKIMEQEVEQNCFYYRANHEQNINSEYIQSLNLKPIELSINGSPVTISGNFSDSSNKNTTIISFGIQYSSVNTEGSKILDVYGDSNSSSPIITLYSDKLFDVDQNGETNKKICIPSETKFNKANNEQYHLVQIVRHLIGEKNGIQQFASYLYIDGKLESNKSQTDNARWRVNRIVLNSVNAIYNLIEIQYVNLLNPQLLVGRESSARLQILTIDEMIYQYYLAYKDIMGAGIVSSAEKTLLDNMSSIKFDGTNTIVDLQFVKTISKDMPIPTMVMDYLISDDEIPSSVLNELFKGYLTKGKEEFGTRPISLYWANGSGSELDTTKPIIIPTFTDEDNHTYTGSWAFELQGTSTMRNRIKNFSLVLRTSGSGDTNKKILMSPNYDPDDASTFLPEQIWTLKADIADSAHANNTAVGKFVNSVCTKFSTSMFNKEEGDDFEFDDDIKPYIKNTLEGFPVLMYFKIGTEVYFFGVYNFNMGRNSYYNLGYYHNTEIRNMKNTIQAQEENPNCPFRYSLGSGTLPSTLAVGEIQDNHAEFDFHQYDVSVLFGEGQMFGDDDDITGASREKIQAKSTLTRFVKSVATAGAYCFANVNKVPVPSKKGKFTKEAYGDFIKNEDDGESNDCITRYEYSEYINNVGETKFYEYVPDISWQFSIGSDGKKKWYDPEDFNTPNWPDGRAKPLTFDEIGGSIDNLLQCISDRDSMGIEQNSYHILDYTSISEYYTICMAFGLVDSVLKNMNIKSWDGKKCYTAFYDMDCAFGEDNKGAESVSALAASDYWYSPTHNGYVEEVERHYDYWTESLGHGFDWPSSYIFAIAKYAQIFYSENVGMDLVRYPQQFWAELRTPYIVGISDGLNGRPKPGELRNTDYFINTYFSSGIGQIPAYLASMNYQVKYLYFGRKMDSEGVESTESVYLANQSAFNGTRIEKVKDWLNKRLHFLDFVFNVQNVSLEIGNYTLPKANDDTIKLVKQNPDVVILTDAFTDANKNSCLVPSNSTPIQVNAPVNTPFIIKRGSNLPQLFLLPNNVNIANTIRITVTATEMVYFYGSKQFTRINKIEPFFTDYGHVVSDNLENIVYGGTINMQPITSGLTVISTSVKNIKLDTPLLSGNLVIDSSDLYGQALTSLNVSGSGLVGTWSGLSSLTTLDISSVNSSGSISVSECPITGENCIISGKNQDSPTTLYSLTMTNLSGSFNLQNTSIENISFTAEHNKEASFEISGDTRLNKLTLQGFKKVVIRNCPNLNILHIIDDSESSIKCETIIVDMPLKYTNPGDEPRKLLECFNSNESVNGVFDFTGYTELNKLSFSGIEKAVVIKIPDHKVSVETFKNNENLEFIDTSGAYSCIELIGDSTFYNCPRYGMRQSWWSKDDTNETTDPKGKDIQEYISEYTNVDNTTNFSKIKSGNYTKMVVSEECRTLANTFYKQSANIKTQYISGNPYTNSWGQKVYNQAININDAEMFIRDIVGGNRLDDEWIENKIIHNSETNEDELHYIVHDKNDIRPPYITYIDGPDCRGNIQSLQGCFNQQGGIIYNGISNATHVPDLSGYTSLTNISQMYRGTNVTCLTAKLLSLPYALNNNDDIDDDSIPDRTLNWYEFVGIGGIKITPDALKNISYRITGFSSLQFTVKDPTSNGADVDILTTETRDESDLENNPGPLNIVSLLWPQTPGEGYEGSTVTWDGVDYIPFKRITYFETFNISDNQYVDYRNLMEFCPNVTRLTSFLKCDLSKARIDNMLQNCTNLVNVSDSFDHTGNMDDINDNNAINLFTFFNWENLANKISYLFSTENSTDYFLPGFKMKKYISNNDFKTILNLLPNYTKITKLSNIFSYCTIKNYDGSEIILGDGTVNMDNVKNINSLFYNCKSNDGTPLNIKRSFFKNLKNVITVINTFTGVYFANMLSYDFFYKRRYTTINDNIYVKDSSTTSGYSPINEAKLHTISYGNNLISNMYNCFKDAKFYNCKCWFDPSDETNFETIDGNRVSLIPNKDYVEYNGDTSYTSYYRLNKGDYVEYPINEPDAYVDTLNNFTNYVNTVHSTLSQFMDITNHNIDGDLGTYKNKLIGYPYEETLLSSAYDIKITPTYCCLPPDIFHACTYDCDLTCVFADTNIIGTIPQHLVKNCYNGTFSNMFRNVNILPNVIYHYDKNKVNDTTYLDMINGRTFTVGTKQITLPEIPIDDNSITITSGDDNATYTLDTSVDAVVLFRNSNGELRRRHPIVSEEYSKSQFSYIPQGYTINANLTEAFTFRYNLPQQVDMVRSSLTSQSLNWPTDADYFDETYSPDSKPWLWPHYTQYFFMVDGSIDWVSLNYIRSPFIKNEQDINFETGEVRQFSTAYDEDNTDNRWWVTRRTANTEKELWTVTDGIFNVFLNLCGEKNIRTGKYTDCGFKLSRPIMDLKRTPKLDALVTGILTVFLNGKVFDNLDAGLLSAPLYGDNEIIQYYGFGRNIIFPAISTVPTATNGLSSASKILLKFTKSNAMFNVYMFPIDSRENYIGIFDISISANMGISNLNNIPIEKANKYYITPSS